MKSLNLGLKAVNFKKFNSKTFFIFLLNIVFVIFECLITQKKEFKFQLIQNSNNEIDIIGHEADSQICPAFWKFMEKFLLDTNE